LRFGRCGAFESQWKHWLCEQRHTREREARYKTVRPFIEKLGKNGDDDQRTDLSRYEQSIPGMVAYINIRVVS
jgi:CRISPR/Cas system CSM-associated protein Csm2 small subunit